MTSPEELTEETIRTIRETQDWSEVERMMRELRARARRAEDRGVHALTIAALSFGCAIGFIAGQLIH